MQFLFSITWGTVSGWWSPVCIAVGLLYAWLLYRQPVNLGSRYRYWLAAARALTVALIAFLLLSVLVRTMSYSPQKPLVLVLQDNSQSVDVFRGSGSAATPAAMVSTLSALKTQLGADYDVREFHFGHDLADGLSRRFSEKQTDISAALKQLNDRFVNQNIGAVILATDGLYNQGADPQYAARNIKAPLYTIAIGDTVAKRDLLIGNINYNKTAFLGNDFEIEILAEAYQAKGETMRITAMEDGRLIASQNLPVTSGDFHEIVKLKLNADKKGTRKYTISIAPVKNEISAENNTETIYVDVLDAKQKILLLYSGPHPDISVIRQCIESDPNYEVKASLLSKFTSAKPGDYNLVILYQVTARGNAALQNLLKAKVPVWYFLGAQIDLQAFDQDQKLLQITQSDPQMQEVFAEPTGDFTDFTLSDSARSRIAGFPPLLAPYASYSQAPPGSVLFKQRIGSVKTSYPLMIFANEGDQRMAVMTAEGVWRWHLAEFENFGDHLALNELFTRSVQYLTANANRERFTVYPAKRVFGEGENVLLNAELYNDALELVNTPDVKINLKSAAGKNYSFLFSRSNNSYQLDAGTLPPGDYSYSASVKLGDKTYTATGELAVKPQNLEMQQSAANFALLRNLAGQSGGKMVLPAQAGGLAALIRENPNIKTIVYQDKHYSELIDLKWVFAFILMLLTAEWFLRKREGEV